MRIRNRLRIACCTLALSGAVHAQDLLIDHQPIALPSIADLGGSERKTSDLEQGIATVLSQTFGLPVTAHQDKRGVLTVESSAGRLYGLPLSPLRRGGNTSDGLATRDNGAVDISRGGVTITLIPSLADLQLAVRRLRGQFGAGAELEVREDGSLLLTTGERPRVTDAGVYSLRPEWAATPSSGKEGLWKLDDGRYVFRDQGREQQLRPAFADMPALLAALRASDPAVVWSLNTDATLSARLHGRLYRFTPDPRLIQMPECYRNQSWWLEAGDFYLPSRDGKTAQRISVE
ncbi:hypothetical protein [Chitinimonas lacunae]|uniref:Uncharacterized protein n=1 Tax=Chitinimonas lacunae TaxID=1963018 RepID=A0ABV8MPD2_9NEIS